MCFFAFKKGPGPPLVLRRGDLGVLLPPPQPLDLEALLRVQDLPQQVRAHTNQTRSKQKKN